MEVWHYELGNAVGNHCGEVREHTQPHARYPYQIRNSQTLNAPILLNLHQPSSITPFDFMSAPADEISNVVNATVVADDDDDDDDEEEEEIAAAPIGTKPRRRRRGGFGKAKEMAMLPFTKAKSQLRRVKSRRALLRSSSSSTSSANASRRGGFSGKVTSVRGSDDYYSGSKCKFCFSRPRVLESSDEGGGSSVTSDPNDPKFTNAMLTLLIEKNDFYSKECNPHMD
ncbi:hypothetical protein PIB30_012535 [Stylosanthes scabra]|uniref:Uncharacterized protein n=1 Tax=Stylosanthes scabra TaxID=79078 RepID=A0ABU6V632_9FABA|nr:hypothetical protein [Stylosanthes scabra]